MTVRLIPINPVFSTKGDKKIPAGVLSKIGFELEK